MQTVLRGWKDHGKPGQLRKPERSGRMVLLESGGQRRAQDPGLLGRTPLLMGHKKRNNGGGRGIVIREVKETLGKSCDLKDKV